MALKIFLIRQQRSFAKGEMERERKHQTKLTLLCPQCGQSTIDSMDLKCNDCGLKLAEHGGIPIYAPQLLGLDKDYDPRFFQSYASIQEEHFWFRGRNRLIQFVVKKFIREKNGTFLEVGCGTGFVLKGISDLLPEWDMTGVDAKLEALEYTSKSVPECQLVQANGANLPFSPRFNAVGAFDVIEHLDNDMSTIKELYRVLIAGGTIFLTVPQHKTLWSKIDEMSGHKRRYSRNELVNKVIASGFDIVFVTSFVSLLLPLLFLSRLSKKKGEGPQIEFKVPRLLNILLQYVMTLELMLIKCGFRFPVGSSLILIAKKP